MELQLNNFLSSLPDSQLFLLTTSLLALHFSGLWFAFTGYTHFKPTDVFQEPVTSLDVVVPNQTALAITSVQDAKDILVDDVIAVTLATPTALSRDVTFNQIAQFATGSAVTGYGAIFKVDNTVLTSPIVYVSAYSPKGIKLTASQITAGVDLFSIPSIPLVSNSW